MRATCASVRLSEWMMLGYSALPLSSTGMQPFIVPDSPTQAIRWGEICCSSSRMPSSMAASIASGSCSAQLGWGYWVE